MCVKCSVEMLIHLGFDEGGDDFSGWGVDGCEEALKGVNRSFYRSVASRSTHAFTIQFPPPTTTMNHPRQSPSTTTINNHQRPRSTTTLNNHPQQTPYHNQPPPLQPPNRPLGSTTSTRACHPSRPTPKNPLSTHTPFLHKPPLVHPTQVPKPIPTLNPISLALKPTSRYHPFHTPKPAVQGP